MRFRTKILAAGKTAAGIEVPPRVVQALSSSKVPLVRVTINGYTYRSAVAVMGGKFMIGVSNENRKAAGVAAGVQMLHGHVVAAAGIVKVRALDTAPSGLATVTCAVPGVAMSAAAIAAVS